MAQHHLASCIADMRVAAQGDADAMLGRMHYDGDGVPQDFAEARRLLGLAAAQGHADAQTVLGEMHNVK